MLSQKIKAYHISVYHAKPTGRSINKGIWSVKDTNGNVISEQYATEELGCISFFANPGTYTVEKGFGDPIVMHENPFMEVPREPFTFKGMEINTPYAVFASKVQEFDGYSMDYGMVFSSKNSIPTLNNAKKIPASAGKLSSGMFGILLYGSGIKVNQIHYVRPYVIYSNGEEELVYYGSIKSFSFDEFEMLTKIKSNILTVYYME